VAENATSQNVRNDPDNGVVLQILLMVLVGAVILLLHEVYYITYEQIIVVFLALGMAIYWVYETVSYNARFRKQYAEMWPKPLVKVPPERERSELKTAHSRDSILIGYDSFKRPFYWTDDIRKYQANLFGMTGAGKTTLLESILEQDIARGVPVIFLDGKGESSMLEKVLKFAAKAGRLKDVRVLDPLRPEISVRYNPFYSKYGNIEEMTSSVFESFKPEKTPEDFFDNHQRAFLSDVARILHYTGKVFTLYDVLVVTCSTEELRKQINIALACARQADPPLSEEEMKSLEVAAYGLIVNMEKDDEYISKLQGLANHMKTYMDRGLSAITSHTDELFTLDDAIDNNLIFIMILNTNTNRFATTSLGRIVLQNLQLMVGMRYARMQNGQKPPFVPVILDEFAEFAYADFARIINQARGAGIGFIFALQSSTQLEAVGRGFAATLTDAPNTKFMQRMHNRQTAESFLGSSGKVMQTRTSVRAEKEGLFDPAFREQSSGTIQQVLETRISDRDVKQLPTGQLQALVVDHELGALALHLHVRQASEYLVDLPVPAYPPLLVPRSKSRGLNLRLVMPKESQFSERRKGARRFGR
jgi:GTPase SAR1 family protein